MSNYTIHPIESVVLCQMGAIYAESTSAVKICDDAAGLFVKVKQNSDVNLEISIDRNEWPALKQAIDQAFELINEMEGSGYGKPD